MHETDVRGLACFRIGSGPPLVYLPGLSAHHRRPDGIDLRIQERLVRPLARDREVWWLQRPVGLPAGTTMADLATTCAEALRSAFDAPVDVVGASTGGSLALQVAADHPDVVRRVVLLSSACRLGPVGRAEQHRLGTLLREGRVRPAGAQLMSLLGTSVPARWALSGAGWALAPALMGVDTSDAAATIAAEDDFDLTGRLGTITTPVRVVGGGRDRFYGVDLFRETAAGLPQGHLRLFPSRGHVGTMSAAEALDAALDFLAAG